MRRAALWVLLPLLFVPTGRASAGDELTGVDHEVMKTLTDTTKLGQLHFHSEPGAFTKERLAEAVKANQGELTKLEKLLEMTFDGPIHVFLYRDVADLVARTKAGSGTVAFATGTCSIHQPIDFVSVHELTHLFALQFPKDEDSVPVEGFFVEGLATALAVHDQDVDIHDWAAVYAALDRVPELTAFRRTWPKGVASGVHPYHVAGSFVGYLVETFGVAKTKRLYVNCLECGQILGRSFALLEADWRAWLEKREVSEKARNHVHARLGIKTRGIPKALSGGGWKPLFEGKSLSGWTEGRAGTFEAREGAIIGTDDKNWAHLDTKKAFGDAIAVRARVTLSKGDAVKIRLNVHDGKANEVILARWRTFLSLKAGGYAVNDNNKIKPGKKLEVVVVNERGTGRLYLDGWLVLETAGAFRTRAGCIGIGVNNGEARFDSVEILTLP